MQKHINSEGYEYRVYPQNCTSAFCGKEECINCKWLPALIEFKQWRDAKKAIQKDPIWARSTWTATIK